MNQLGGKEAYDKLQRMLKERRDNFRVMEREVDIDIQMKYFEEASKVKKELPKEVNTILENAEEKLADESISKENKMQLLNQLASYEDVKAFRILEAYLNDPSAELEDWAYLAYQESLMILESAFSEEDKVFISSGMGGKGDKLRYFVVFIKDDASTEFEEVQIKLIKKELSYQFEKNNAELESIEFNNQYYIFNCLIPLDINISSLFKNTIEEINQFGNFLSENFLVTNVKRMSLNEIDKFIEEKEKEALENDSNNDDALNEDEDEF